MSGSAYEMMKNKEHLTSNGVEKIVSIKASINLGLSTELKSEFLNFNSVVRPIIKDSKIPHEEWIVGFTSGEGCFKVTVYKSPNSKIGFKVQLVFHITQHYRDKELMESLITYFGCGKLEKDPRGPWLNFSVYKFNENYENILPFFKKYKIVGKKYKDFKDWCKVAEMIKAKDHLTGSGLSEIKYIKSGMNKGRS
jgi:hypothetical protein